MIILLVDGKRRKLLSAECRRKLSLSRNVQIAAFFLAVAWSVGYGTIFDKGDWSILYTVLALHIPSFLFIFLLASAIVLNSQAEMELGLRTAPV